MALVTALTIMFDPPDMIEERRRREGFVMMRAVRLAARALKAAATRWVQAPRGLVRVARPRRVQCAVVCKTVLRKAARRLETKGGPGQRRDITRNAFSLKGQESLGSMRCAEIWHFMDGMGNMIIGVMEFGTIKGHTDSERLAKQEGPVAIADAVAAGPIMLPLLMNPRIRLSVIAVATPPQGISHVIPPRGMTC